MLTVERAGAMNLENAMGRGIGLGGGLGGGGGTSNKDRALGGQGARPDVDNHPVEAGDIRLGVAGRGSTPPSSPPSPSPPTRSSPPSPSAPPSPIRWAASPIPRWSPA